MMRKYGPYLLGFLVLIAMFATVFVVTGIYDAGDKSTIVPYFMRRSATAKDTPGQPKSLSEIGSKRVCDWLRQYYVKEYFSVIPGNTSQKSNIQTLSNSAVFKGWMKNTEPKISDMLDRGMRRTVTVFDEIFKPEASDYWRVEYELKTWTRPNDMTEIPQITRGTIYLGINCTGELKQTDNPGEFLIKLRNGENPVSLFNFKVLSVKE